MQNRIVIVLEIIVLMIVIYFRHFYPTAINWLKSSPIIKALLFFLVFLIAINLISNGLKYYYRKKYRLRIGEKNNIYYGIENIAKFILFLGFISAVSMSFEMDIRVLLTSLSIVAAAIAIITREFIHDFLTGLNLSFSEVFDINDYVNIPPHKGKIISISLFKTTILNDNGDIVNIPNSKVNSNEIINYTKSNLWLMSIDFQVDILLIASIELFENELIKSLSEFSEHIDNQSFNLKIVDLKKEYIDFKFQYKINKMDTEILKLIRKQMVRQVLNYITERQIKLAHQ